MSSAAHPVPAARSHDALWEGVGRLVDRASSLDDLRIHGLELVAAARMRERGGPVPEELAADARSALLTELAVPALLARVRDACDDPVVLLKGPAVAARYPARGLRPFLDVDVLVPDAAGVERRLLAAGFVHVGDERDWEAAHHRRPLVSPGIPLSIEVHSRPKWVAGLREPSPRALIERAVPSRVAEGVLELPPDVHAVVAAAHAWSERPLGKLLDLVDAALLRQAAGETEVEAAARALGLGRVWAATSAAADALFVGAAPTFPLRTWARSLPEARGGTVLETHLERLLAEFSARPAGPSLRRSASTLVHRTARPQGGETWRRKLSRGRHALGSPSARRDEHERSLDEKGLR